VTRKKWAAGLLILVGMQAGCAGQTAETLAPTSAPASASASASPAASDKAADDKAAAEKKAALSAQQEAAAAVARQRTGLAARATVDAYFQAINAADYRTAFDLGGHNFNSSYDSFRAGFDNTASDEWEITRVAGDRVYLTLTAHNLDCTTQVWHGYYVVTDGELTDAHLKGGKFQDCD
jgi:hypothetical protein